MRHVLFALLLLTGIPAPGQALDEEGILLYSIREDGQRHGEPGQVVRYRVTDTARRRLEVNIDGRVFEGVSDYAVVPRDPDYAPSRAFLLLRGQYPGKPGHENYYDDRFHLASNILAAFPAHPLGDELFNLLCKATAEREGFQTDGKSWDETLDCYSRYLERNPDGDYRDLATWQVERPRTYEYEGYVGPMIEHARAHQQFLEKYPYTLVRNEVLLGMAHLLMRAHDDWQDARHDNERGGFTYEESLGFLEEARDVYRDLLDSNDLEVREQARVKLYEIGQRRPLTTPSNEQASAIRWSSFGEGFSSSADGKTIKISYRMHTAPSLTVLNNSGLIVDALEITPVEIRVSVGEPLRLDQLQIRAIDDHGRVVPEAPLSFQLQGPAALVDYEAFVTYGENIVAIAPGQATIWVDSLLPTTTRRQLRERVALIVQ